MYPKCMHSFWVWAMVKNILLSSWIYLRSSRLHFQDVPSVLQSVPFVAQNKTEEPGKVFGPFLIHFLWASHTRRFVAQMSRWTLWTFYLSFITWQSSERISQHSGSNRWKFHLNLGVLPCRNRSIIREFIHIFIRGPFVCNAVEWSKTISVQKIPKLQDQEHAMSKTHRLTFVWILAQPQFQRCRKSRLKILSSWSFLWLIINPLHLFIIG